MPGKSQEQNRIACGKGQKMKITKTSQMNIKKSDIPHPDVLSVYVESLKGFARDKRDLNPSLVELIDKLPSPKKVKKDLSFEETRLLFETISYLWRSITGNSIIEENKVVHQPEALKGDYWLLKNGIMLSGPNHFTIAKHNLELMASILGLDRMAAQYYLAKSPEQLIMFLLRNGAVRLFASKDKKLYFQMSPEVFGRWGKQKVKSFEIKDRSIRVIDFKTPYKGWDSGILIRC
jgi:hypothetical protein